MAPNVAALRLMLVTDDRFLEAGRDLTALCAAAIRGGVSSVELRLKRTGVRDLVAIARGLVAALPVPVLVNDRLDVAIAAGAAGVHLGPDDLPLGIARKAAPPGFLIGASVGRDEWTDGYGREADYWGVGPFRETSTKADAGDAIGLEGFALVVRRAGGIPCLAIGGVQPMDVRGIFAAGGMGVAISAGILGQADVEAAARRYATELP